MKNKWILHLDIDSFFASVEILQNPSLRGKPVVVGGMPYERGVASTASYEARKYGVHSGMPLKKAYELCPNCIFLRGSYHLYKEFSEKFFSLLSRYTPDIEEASLDEAYLDLTHCNLLYPSIPSQAKKIKEEVEKELKIGISASLASNKLLAKLGTSKAKPGGFIYIEPGKEVEFLGELTIDKLPGIGLKTQMIFTMMGVDRIKDLWEISKETLKSLFGISGYEIFFQSRGIDERIVEREFIPKSMSRETTFLEDLWDREMILAHFAYLSDRLASSLREESLSSFTVEIKVRLSDFTTYTRRQSLISPTQDMYKIYEIAKKLYLKNFYSSPFPLRLVGVRASDLVREINLHLFEENFLKRENLMKSLDTVRRRFGFGSVITAIESRLEEIYEFEQRRGFTLKTASLTK
ncbi:MAG: DNA polymerase IV [Acidobacteriota bacterium]